MNITERWTEAISSQNRASNLGNTELVPVTGRLAAGDEKAAICCLDQGGNSCLQGLTLLVTSMLRLARLATDSKSSYLAFSCSISSSNLQGIFPFFFYKESLTLNNERITDDFLFPNLMFFIFYKKKTI